MPLSHYLARKGERLYQRDTLRLPALRQAQDRRRGFAPLHTPLFISLLVHDAPAEKDAVITTGVQLGEVRLAGCGR